MGRPDDLVAGALRLDDLAIAISLIAILTAAFCVLLSIREPAAEQAGSGEYHALLLGSVLGMVLLAQAQNLVTFFVAIETLSIPLYILCATNLRREGSLESGLKYLIVGSLGSATLLYGMAFLYGGSGSTDFAGIADGIGHERRARRPADPDRDRDGGGRARLQDLDRPLPPVDARRLPGRADPDHRASWRWRPRPRPSPSSSASSTSPSARRSSDWQPALAVLAAISIVVGNVGALGQDSLKRLLGYSGVAQAGYMLGGLVVASRGRRQRARLLPRRLRLHEPRRLRGDRRPRARDPLRRRHPRASAGLGARAAAARLAADDLDARPWPGCRRPSGFIGKLYLIEALVEGDYTWLAVFIAVGTMISLAYYLRVVAAMWMRPERRGRAGATPGDRRRLARGRPDRPRRRPPLYLVGPALLAAAATVFFGVIPQPLVEFAEHAGAALFHDPRIAARANRRPPDRRGDRRRRRASASGRERRWPQGGRAAPRGAR